MRALAVSVVIVGCAPAAPTATPNEPPEYRASGRTSCAATVTCYERCPAPDTECTDKCDRRASPDAFHASHTLFACLVRSNCNADPCAQIECKDELQMCGFAIDVATQSLRDPS